VNGFSQHDSVSRLFLSAEKGIREIEKKAFHGTPEKERIEGNKELISAWDQMIRDPRILEYSFDSLKKDISILRSSDRRFMLITWNLQKDDGTHAYFGYLLVNNTKRIKTGFLKHETVYEYETYKLIDRSAAVASPENYIGTPEKWFGMLYTQIVECDGYYTLIGWDGNNKLTTRKFVDVLYFRSDGAPVFGKDVFRIPKKNPRRMMFEYSSEVTMSLRYNETRNMIIYNHLVPRDRNGAIDNQFQFYGPDAQFDGLQMKNDKWVVVEDIEANSDIAPMKESKKPKPRKQNPVYKPK
jgi:hypothetical protein